MFTMTPVTDKVELDTHGLPVDPWGFAKAIESNQEYNAFERRQTILFNKGRYFEGSVYDQEVREQVSELTGLKVEYSNMLCGSWKKLEEYVLAMNCMNFYVHINVDWI